MPKGIKGFQKGHLGYNWGHPQSEETKKKLSRLNLGKKGYWSGKERPLKEKVGNTALHLWIIKKLGRPSKCEHCGKANKKSKGGRSWLQWANKDHKYKRNLTDWIHLCPSCHKIYDYKAGIYGKGSRSFGQY